MNIQVQDNGNFAFIKDNQIKLITTRFNVHQHPRHTDTLLFNDCFEPREEGSLTVKASELTINGIKPPFQDIDGVKGYLFTDVILRRTQPPLTMENDPYYLMFKAQDTYEKLLLFAQTYVTGQPVEYKDTEGKLQKTEYYCEFQTFHIRITLNYYYMINDTRKISHILMSGNTEYVTYPLKAYYYDAQGEISNYSYEKFSWQRSSNNS